MYNTSRKDLLTGITINGDSQSFTYNSIGLPTVYRGKNLTWNQRNLLGRFDGNTFTYDATGMRLTKNNTTYEYFGNNLIKETRGTDVIEYGVLSDECRIACAKNESRKDGIMFLVVTIIVSIIVSICIKLGSKIYYGVILIVIFIITTIIAFITPIKRIHNFKITIKITIDNEYIVLNNIVLDNSIQISINKIKKVIDEDDWYKIVFKNNKYWICQKNLITQGTIVDFEKLFDGKIIRRKQHKVY